MVVPLKKRLHFLWESPKTRTKAFYGRLEPAFTPVRQSLRRLHTKICQVVQLMVPKMGVATVGVQSRIAGNRLDPRIEFAFLRVVGVYARIGHNQRLLGNVIGGVGIP